MSDETPEFGGFGVGSRLAGYRLDEQIGRGGMAVVYRAYDIRLERPVAIKVLSPELARDEAFRQRFIRESRTAAAVDHPNIIPIFEAGEANGVLFIAMRFVHGPNVQELVDAEGALPAARACHIITQVAAGLEAAHSHGLVHRDVKPGNMLLDMAGGGDYPGHTYLSDFGLSKRALSVSALTSTGQFLGTLDYVAPEQIEARAVTGRADEYALACSAFTMLTGHPPFVRDESVAVMWAQISAPPPALTSRRPDLPAAVDEVMAKALAKVPTERYGTCPEFAAALRRACGLESGPGLAPEPAADFPDVPLRESTQVVPVVPADARGTSRSGRARVHGSRSAARSRLRDRPARSRPGRCRRGGFWPGHRDPGPGHRGPRPGRRDPGPATEVPGLAAGDPGPGNPARPPSCPGRPAPFPKPSPQRPGSRRLGGTDPGPLRPDLPPRRPRCHPTTPGMFPRSLRVAMPRRRPASRRPSAAGPRRAGPNRRGGAAGSGPSWRWPSSWSWPGWGTS